ncbi:hypothetical protein BJ508DRAFT_332198 [Ascobolus immersus RN42]|uniref:Uncharacterized protein n=1 Tax=Ascobolus immersus RN42 TaxID=1160509 RepID=A0A3N4HNT2_ASCIM|nr:hypothetical protein BJ508DRAFT_332198 [Ascobolus immersus RN42]
MVQDPLGFPCCGFNDEENLYEGEHGWQGTDEEFVENTVQPGNDGYGYDNAGGYGQDSAPPEDDGRDDGKHPGDMGGRGKRDSTHGQDHPPASNKANQPPPASSKANQPPPASNIPPNTQEPTAPVNNKALSNSQEFILLSDDDGCVGRDTQDVNRSAQSQPHTDVVIKTEKMDDDGFGDTGHKSGPTGDDEPEETESSQEKPSNEPPNSSGASSG